MSIRLEMSIRKLPNDIINKISAGEVIERPLSVIRELIDNSIDAQSKSIKIIIRDGGKSYISVIDDGHGMSKDDLAICLDAHTTSKLDSDDLFNINTLGFRGEALFSLSVVSKVDISSYYKNCGYVMSAEYGKKLFDSPQISNISNGTIVEISKLFLNTPARLQFLKPTAIEKKLIEDYIKAIAMKYWNVSFELIHNDKTIFSISNKMSFQNRVFEILGQEFCKNALYLTENESNESGLYKIEMLCSLPTLNKPNYSGYFVFINGRLIKDNIIISIINSIYRDYTPPLRYPIIVMMLSVPAEEIDMNVHPAKMAVNFRNVKFLRDFVSRSLRKCLESAGHQCKSFDSHTMFKASPNKFDNNDLIVQNEIDSQPDKDRNTTFENQHSVPNKVHDNISQKKITDNSIFMNMISKFQDNKVIDALFQQSTKKQSADKNIGDKIFNDENVNSKISSVTESNFELVKSFSNINTLFSSKSQALMESPSLMIYEKYDLGEPICQIFSSYIICESENGIVIIDQHAAHERINYEKLKRTIFDGEKIQSEALVIPILIDCQVQPSTIQILSKIGFEVSKTVQGISVRAIPILMKGLDIKEILIECISNVEDADIKDEIMHQIERVCASIACKSSIKSGKKLSIIEMRALVSQMVGTPHSGQCNHGRPTNIFISKSEIAKMFLRTK